MTETTASVCLCSTQSSFTTNVWQHAWVQFPFFFINMIKKILFTHFGRECKNRIRAVAPTPQHPLGWGDNAPFKVALTE